MLIACSDLVYFVTNEVNMGYLWDHFVIWERWSVPASICNLYAVKLIVDPEVRNIESLLLFSWFGEWLDVNISYLYLVVYFLVSQETVNSVSSSLVSSLWDFCWFYFWGGLLQVAPLVYCTFGGSFPWGLMHHCLLYIQCDFFGLVGLLLLLSLEKMSGMRCAVERD